MDKLITVQIEETSYTIALGSTVAQALQLANLTSSSQYSYAQDPIVGAMVNDDLQPLSSYLMCSSKITMVRLFSDLGKRMYRHSLCYLLGCAVQQLFPKRHLVIGHSLGDGYYYSFDDQYVLTPSDIDAIAEKMHTIVQQSHGIDRIQLPYQQAVDYFRSRHADETVSLLAYRNEPVVNLYQMDGYMDVTYEPLVPNTAIMTVWELRPYDERGMLLRYPRSFDFTALAPWKDNPLLYSVFKEYKEWGRILDASSVGSVNEICARGEIQSFIRMVEALQAKKISHIADMIVGDHNIRVVFIAGPSSSGKTTFAQKLCIQLQVLGYTPIKISLDNYYKTKEYIPLDEQGERDYEALEALDTAQFQDDLARLYDGEAVNLHNFDFKQNKRIPSDHETVLNRHAILVIEGIHGLNPNLVPQIDPDSTFRIYISALTQMNLDDHNRISTTDNRILRRIVRDNRTRGVSADTTLAMWSSVQRGENLHIFPYQNNADVMLNSALDYELGVLAPFAQPLLRGVKPSSGKAYPMARRLLAFLDNIYPIPEGEVPPESLLREFIGGSIFESV